MPIFGCALYCKCGAIYSAHPWVYAMWTVVPDIYNAFTAPHIQASIFNWTYLRCCWRYVDNSAWVILLTWCQYSIQPPVYAMWTVAPDLYNVISAPNIQAPKFNWTYLRCYWGYLVHSMIVMLQPLCQIQRTSSRLRYLNCGPGNIHCIFNSAYSDFNFQLNVSAWLLEKYLHRNVRHTADMLPNTAHFLQLTLCVLWFRSYTMHLQLRIFRLRYSTERISGAIGDMSRIQWALHCNLDAKFSPQQPVRSMWTVVPVIYNAFTAPHIQTSIFIWTYLRCYCRYLENATRYILQTWSQIQRTSSSLRYMKCGPGHIQSIYSSAYSGHNIQLNVSLPLLEISRQFHERYTAILETNKGTFSRFRCVYCGSGHIQCI
jgi:hypothetical protein